MHKPKAIQITSGSSASLGSLVKNFESGKNQEKIDKILYH